MYALNVYMKNVLWKVTTFEHKEDAEQALRFAQYENNYLVKVNEYNRELDFELVECEPIYFVPVHMCPAEGQWETQCCNRNPHELLAHRMTIDPTLVTCKGRGIKCIE